MDVHSLEIDGLQAKIDKLEKENRELKLLNRINESLYLSILDAIPINIFLEDAEGHTIYANQQACQSNNMNLEDLIGKTVYDFFPKEIADVNREIDLEVWRQRKLITKEAVAGFRGVEHHMFSGKTIIHVGESNQDFLLGFGLDISDRVKAERLLRESEEKFRSVIEQAGDSFFLIGMEGIITDANPIACELLHFSKEELIGMHVGEIFFCLPNNLQPEAASFEDVMTGKNHSKIPVDINIRTIRIGDKQRYFAFCRDIRGKKRAEAQIQHMAYHDALTDLPNRWYIRSYFQQNIENSNTKFAFLLLDLDHFKVINDSLGHEAGDLLIIEVAKRLRRAAENQLNFLARFGGDEFTLLVPELADEEEIAIICEKIISELSEPFYLFGQKIKISASIGISLYPEHGDNLNSLIKNADIAMYHSKDEGRGCYSLYRPAMKEQANERLDLEIHLRKALEENEFVLHYQPKINIKTGQIVGMEALIRWNKNNRLVYPDSFIPIAEETGLIIPIGEWVIREACRQCKEWHDTGFEPLTVSVNLSPKQFQKQNLGEVIVSVLEETGLPPWSLELELTEGMLMKQPEESVEVLKKLKDLGIKISIDDFGKGFSSLSYLKLFPIDILKIDKSFIMNLEVDKANATIASAVVSLAHSLDLQVTAEGVETEAQSQFLLHRSCDFAQGYYISKPLPPNEMKIWCQAPSGRSVPGTPVIT